jgi:ComEC/Rec2-related protein
MRVANIAHLLAISGLHMGLLTGFVYGALRLVLALIPALALRYPIRKWAAAGALGAGAFYLVLSGGNVATERAFIQVAVMLTAVMLDRRAITLRSVAIAAMILLLHRPETLFSPGFQMSFAATAALVAVFTGLRDAVWSVAPARHGRNGYSRWSCHRSSRGWPRPPSRRRISTGSPSTADREPPDGAADGQRDHARRGRGRDALAAGPVGVAFRGDGTRAGLDTRGRCAGRCLARRGRPCAEPPPGHAGPDRASAG